MDDYAQSAHCALAGGKGKRSASGGGITHDRLRAGLFLGKDTWGKR